MTVNSLEQLCINYANEKLQQYFVQNYLVDLQADYEREGISLNPVDMAGIRTSCADLLAGNPGVFALLNEVRCQFTFCKIRIIAVVKYKD